MKDNSDMENSFIRRTKYMIWRMIYSPVYSFRYLKTRRDRERLRILDSKQTCKYIVENRCSVSRFGDGELQIISHWLSSGKAGSFDVDSFQEYDSELAKRLYEVLKSRNRNLLVCMPYSFKNATVYSGYNRLFSQREFLSRKGLIDIISPEGQFWGDAEFTRFYLHRTDICSFPEYVNLLKSLWDGRDILIIEGKYSRLGVGNDLFDNTVSTNRIICPATNAFSRYAEILNVVINNSANRLVLIALGQTATVLAYDLSENGIQALDIGHVDIEYEWYLMGAKEKVPIPNKYVNEVKSGRITSKIQDRKYFGEIICDLS